MRTTLAARAPTSLLALVCVSVGFGALSPVLAEIQEAFGGGAALGAALVSSFSAGRLAAGLPVGVLIDRVGAGRVIFGGALIFLLGSLVGWAAPHFWILDLGRLLQGVGLAVVPAGVLARMMSGASAQRAGGPMALYQTAVILGSALGPSLAGPLATVAGWRSAFLLCALFGLAAVVCALPERAAVAGPRGQRTERSRRAGGWQVWLAVTLVMLPNAIAAFDRFAVSQLVLPLYASSVVGFDAAATGLLLGTQTIVSLALAGPSGWAANRWGTRPVIALSALFAAGGVLLMPLAHSAPELYGATLLYAVGLSVLGVCGAIYVFELQGFSTGRLVTIYRLSTDVTQVVGPLLVGLLLEARGFTAALLAVGLFGLSALLGLLVRGGALHPSSAER